MKASILFFAIATWSIAAFGQYEFEKKPSIHYKRFQKWKMHIGSNDQPTYSISVPRFFSNDDPVTCKITSQEGEDTSIIRVYKGTTLIQTFIEPEYMDSIALGPVPKYVYVEDVNGDGLNDLKILVPNNGCCGAYNFYVRVIYLFQTKNKTFIKTSYDDFMMNYVNQPERDFDGDGNFEIITQTFVNYGPHNYWAFNLYNFNGTALINVNQKSNYPILVQLIDPWNYATTKKMSRATMKKFAKELPDGYDRK